ncbi:MAG TPA: ATP-binding protein [Anaerolineaceae bacterium]
MEISNSSTPPTTVTQVFPGRCSSLEKIAEFVRTAAQQAGLDDFATYQVETAVDEACSNIIEHAYQNTEGEIICTCREEIDRLIITLQDQGQPFDGSNIPEPDLCCDLESRSNHGLGLYFMRKWMDEVRFEYDPALGNKLTMIKRKEK